MNVEQRALCFSCHGASLYGVAHVPDQIGDRGMLIVVGGPQYRAGSHRQFTLLARHLAARGVPVMRFDYRGMGDSDGDAKTFEDVQDDIRHALDRFFAEIPAMKAVVIWGLCDAASAALFYAHHDSRVHGLVLLNPWVRTTEGMAKAYLKHYYFTRLLERELWKKIFQGRFDFRAAIRSLAGMVGKALPGMRERQPAETAAAGGQTCRAPSLPDRMLDSLGRFKGQVLLIISGNDLTAKEFLDLANSSRQWRKLLGSARVQRRDLPDANHTFSRCEWRDQVASWTRDWITSW